MLRFSEGYCYQSFRSLSTKLYGKHGSQEEYRPLLFGDVPYLKSLWQFDIFVNIGPYRVKNFKTLLLLQVSSNHSHTSWGRWLSWWNTDCYFSCQLVSCKTSNLRVNRKIVKYVTSSNRLTVERHGWKFVSCGSWNSTCRVISWQFIEFNVGSFGALCNLFQTATAPPVLIQCQLYGKHGKQGKLQEITFLAIC